MTAYATVTLGDHSVDRIHMLKFASFFSLLGLQDQFSFTMHIQESVAPSLDDGVSLSSTVQPPQL